MDRIQEVSEGVPAEMNTRRGFARGVALLWKEWFSILAPEGRSKFSQEKDYPIYLHSTRDNNSCRRETPGRYTFRPA